MKWFMETSRTDLEDWVTVALEEDGSWKSVDRRHLSHTISDRPSIFKAGEISWQSHGEEHRESGKAVIRPSGSKWAVEGENVKGRMLLW